MVILIKEDYFHSSAENLMRDTSVTQSVLLDDEQVAGVDNSLFT